MALLSLNFDVQAGQLVFSETNPTPFTLPALHQEDGPTIEFRALKRIRQNASPFFERINFSGYDLLISVGTAGSILASATSWTASDSNDLLTGRLDLNTAGITGLADSTECIFEIRLFDGTGYYRGQQVCRVKKSVALTSSLQPVVNDIALGKREASRTYIPQYRATGFTMIDEATSEEMVVRLFNGTLQASPLS